MNTHAPILSLKNIHFVQSGFQLLSDISFSVSKGQIIGLLGVNGAGKSTTLKVASGCLYPSVGEVHYTDNVRVGYLPERPPLIPTWSVKQYLQHICVLQGLPKAQHQSAIERVIGLCDLSGILAKPIATLSKGNQQRVAIAQAIIHEPNLLILDEPTSGLDPQQIMQFRHLLRGISSETAIVLSSHIMQEVTALCDHVVMIHKGEKMAEMDLSASHSQLLIEFAQPIVSDVFDDMPAWRKGEGCLHQFDVASQSEQDKLLAQCIHKQLPIKRVSGVAELLENTFLEVIGQHRSQSATLPQEA